jgi:hypothetical protein
MNQKASQRHGDSREIQMEASGRKYAGFHRQFLWTQSCDVTGSDVPSMVDVALWQRINFGF